MKATRSRRGWVHTFITHCLQLNLQLHTIDLVRTRRISSFCTVALQLARFRFNWHDASRGPSAIAELLVLLLSARLCSLRIMLKFGTKQYIISLLSPAYTVSHLAAKISTIDRIFHKFGTLGTLIPTKLTEHIEALRLLWISTTCSSLQTSSSQ